MVGFSVAIICAVITVGFILVIGKTKNTPTLNEQDSGNFDDYILGIDVSHYQGYINWTQVKQSHHPIEFVFIRSTMGVDGRDQHYERNWKQAKEQDFLRGTYHYFRPNEPGFEQFENFKKYVRLNSGDLPPVLDIEEEGQKGNAIISEIKVWLNEVESHYGIKPIIYSSYWFYKTFLAHEFSGYILWIANYNSDAKDQIRNTEWTFHQFTEEMRVSGITGNVDGNDYNGTIDELQSLRLS